MQDDALKQLWKGQHFEAGPVLTDEAQIAALKKRMKIFNDTIQRRDHVEIAVCLFMIVVFARNIVLAHGAALRFGWFVLLGTAGFVAWKLMANRRRAPRAEPNATVCEVLKVELQIVENQIGLLKSYVWWCLLPPFILLMPLYWQAPGSVSSKLLFWVIYLAVGAAVHGLNLWTVKRKLLPLKRELESALDR